jgi:hypothetical protein
MPAEILEYDYFDAALTVTIATQRPEAVPSMLFVAGTLHNDLVGRIRAALREKKDALTPYLPTAGGFPLYGIRKMMPGGTVRAVDSDYFLEVTRLRFDMGLAFLPTAWQAGEAVALGVERHIEKACKDMFEALGVPTSVIPGDNVRLGETFIDVMCELGAATNQGVIHDVNG